MGDEGMLKSKNSKLMVFFKGVERVGNKLPHPFWIFCGLMGIVAVLSAILSAMGVSVTYSQADAKGVVEVVTTSVVNLLSKEEIQKFFTGFISGYASNPVLGNALVISMGMALAEDTNFFDAFLRKTLFAAPRCMVTFAFAIVAICANIAGDSGQILAATLGAVVFKSLGRNPWIGIAAGYAGASAGYTANMMIANADVTLSSITNSVAAPLGFPNIHPLVNWFFLAAATPVLALVTTVIVETFLVKFIGDYKVAEDSSAMNQYALTGSEKRGLRYSGIGFAVFMILLLSAIVPSTGALRGPDGSLLPKSPFISSTVALVALLFGVLGVCYGFGSGKFKTLNEVPKMMQKGIGKVSALIVMLLPVSLFISLFTRSNLATVLSVKGQVLLESLNIGKFPILILLILFTAFINLFMNSGSAKWFIFAPIFVPMLARMDIHPALTQIAYRIGDSCTNNIAPMNACMMVVLMLFEQYKRKEDPAPGIGTLMSMQIPFSIMYLISFTALLAIFYFFHLPLGPGIA